MAFQVNEEAVSVMRDLAKKIPNSVEGLLQANQEVLSCYEDVRETVGPHTQEIEAIVHNCTVEVFIICMEFYIITQLDYRHFILQQCHNISCYI